MHELFAFTDRFCRDYDFASVIKERFDSVSNIVLGQPRQVDSPRLGKKIWTLGKSFDYDQEDGPAEAPDDWYRWVAINLGLRRQPYWPKLDRVILYE